MTSTTILLSLFVFCKYGTVESVIKTFFGQQLRVSPSFRDNAILNNSNDIRVIDGGESVGDDDGGAALTGLVQCLLHNLLTLCVQGRGGLVQEKNSRVSYQSPGNGDALLLSSTQLSPLGSNISVVTLETLHRN